MVALADIEVMNELFRILRTELWKEEEDGFYSVVPKSKLFWELWQDYKEPIKKVFSLRKVGNVFQLRYYNSIYSTGQQKVDLLVFEKRIKTAVSDITDEIERFNTDIVKLSVFGEIEGAPPISMDELFKEIFHIFPLKRWNENSWFFYCEIPNDSDFWELWRFYKDKLKLVFSVSKNTRTDKFEIRYWKREYETQDERIPLWIFVDKLYDKSIQVNLNTLSEIIEPTEEDKASIIELIGKKLENVIDPKNPHLKAYYMQVLHIQEEELMDKAIESNPNVILIDKGRVTVTTKTAEERETSLEKNIKSINSKKK